ncbi:MAG: hypothetical protein HYW07_00835 [Candidatus Latescibacteria bacterium]|nr:hypothetical protein [Candidatus Latescibacterota bacterium]
MRAMIGIDFASFLILLVISAVVSAILHYGFKFYIVPGTASYLSKVVIGWFGAWLGSPILGHWWEGLNYQHVYFAPAILGSFGILILAIDGIKTIARVWGGATSDSQDH